MNKGLSSKIRWTGLKRTYWSRRMIENSLSLVMSTLVSNSKIDWDHSGPMQVIFTIGKDSSRSLFDILTKSLFKWRDTIIMQTSGSTRGEFHLSWRLMSWTLTWNYIRRWLGNLWTISFSIIWFWTQRWHQLTGQTPASACSTSMMVVKLFITFKCIICDSKRHTTGQQSLQLQIRLTNFSVLTLIKITASEICPQLNCLSSELVLS